MIRTVSVAVLNVQKGRLVSDSFHAQIGSGNPHHESIAHFLNAKSIAPVAAVANPHGISGLALGFVSGSIGYASMIRGIEIAIFGTLDAFHAPPSFLLGFLPEIVDTPIETNLGSVQEIRRRGSRGRARGRLSSWLRSWWHGW